MVRTGRYTVLALIGACAALAIAAGASAADISPTGESVTGQSRNPGYAARFMQLFDTDNDGKVTAAEIEADQSRLFRALDIDGDGKLSVEEVSRRGYILQIWRVTTMFDLMDVNGDRQLTIDEITAPMQRWFSRYDRNGDGAMDAGEVPVRQRPGSGRRTER
jgi:Ca2+-binding EF-hand superfamily protein